ncbi:translesion DNA synthesis-associated protein ImuA [Chitinimonas viridis]|uniref:Translesion DNA synthesis-associated protein ImuA n=1 Tax=Chitinimonas viridis TaxID=664880 RepID=A0ABT8BBB6_9NEIS|nr:translesion DNA synthesis-associated protein ImuA [Chitinimonas viridis]MDN3579085.1 translesion DNA synthesis-associated protein ImuA [Chitinimonas viridis]
MKAALVDVLKHPGVWRGDGYSQTAVPTTPCGHERLAPLLPGAGWPLAAVTEVIASRAGCGELKLLLPALARLSQAGKQVLLIAPPQIPYAPAWQAAGVDLRQLTWVNPKTEHDALWAMEQSLREPACGAVIGWFDLALSDRNCRRLQLAAEQGGGSGFVLRHGRAENVSSPFGLRLGVESVAGGVAVQVLKRRGAAATQAVFLPHGHQPTPARHPATGPTHVVASTTPAFSTARRTASEPYAYAA